jgi:hypothetical protein
MAGDGGLARSLDREECPEDSHEKKTSFFLGGELPVRIGNVLGGVNPGWRCRNCQGYAESKREK